MDSIRSMAIAAMCAGLLFAGCAQVPPQSIELSAAIGRDLSELQRSHRHAVDLLHDRLVERIQHHVDTVEMPTYVKFVIERLGPRLVQDLEIANRPGASPADREKVFNEMQAVVRGVTQRVERARASLLAPVELARKERLQELDLAYARVQQANGVITAHLASIAKVNQVQDDLLARVGLEDFRAKVGDKALSLDSGIQDLLGQGGEIEAIVARLKKFLEGARKAP